VNLSTTVVKAAKTAFSSERKTDIRLFVSWRSIREEEQGSPLLIIIILIIHANAQHLNHVLA
jgi:hypothetical protein